MPEKERRYELAMQQPPSPEQMLALQGLVQAFGWQLQPLHETVIEGKPQQEVALIESEERNDAPVSGPGSNLILKDEHTRLLISDRVEELKFTEARAELLLKIEEITEPYAHLFDDKVPPTSTNERTRIRRKVKNHIPNLVSWAYSESKNDTDYKYNYALAYRLGETSNSLKSVTMSMLTTREQYLDLKHGEILPHLKLEFNKGVLTVVQLVWSDTVATALNKTAAGTPLEQYMRDFSLFKPNRAHITDGRGQIDCSLYLSLDRPELRTYVSRDSYWLHYDGYRPGVEAVADFRFKDLNGNDFTYFPVDEMKFRWLEKEFDTTFKNSLQADEYLNLLKSILSLIPAVSLHEIE